MRSRPANGAAVAEDGVAVVALLAPRGDHAVAADRAGLEEAGRTATVATHGVAVVARLAAVDDAVAAASPPAAGAAGVGRGVAVRDAVVATLAGRHVGAIAADRAPRGAESDHARPCPSVRPRVGEAAAGEADRAQTRHQAVVGDAFGPDHHRGRERRPVGIEHAGPHRIGLTPCNVEVAEEIELDLRLAGTGGSAPHHDVAAERRALGREAAHHHLDRWQLGVGTVESGGGDDPLARRQRRVREIESVADRRADPNRTRRTVNAHQHQRRASRRRGTVDDHVAAVGGR